jgi:hypothetical protein
MFNGLLISLYTLARCVGVQSHFFKDARNAVPLNFLIPAVLLRVCVFCTPSSVYSCRS